MGAGEIRAGKAFVEVGADTSPLQRALNVGKSALKGFAVAGAAAFVAFKGAKALIGPAEDAISGFAAKGDELEEMSARTGMSAQALSELGYAAGVTGADLGTVETAVRKMQNAITDAANGGGAATKALDAIGLSAQQLQSLTPEQQFETIAKALNGIVDPTARAAAAMDIFGKSGTGLLPMLGDLDALKAKAQQLGVTMSTEDARAAGALQDAFDDLGAAGGGLKNAFAGPLAGVLTQIAGTITGSLPTIRGWASSVGEILANNLATTWQIMLSVGEAVSGTWERIKAATAPILETIGAVVSVAFERISAVVGPIMQSVGDAVSSAWQSVTATTGPVLAWLQDAVVTAFASVGFVLSNFGNIAATALVGAAYEVVKFGNQVAYFFGEVCPTVIGWFGRNWRDIFKTMADYTETVIVNLETNLFNFFTAVYNWLSGEEFNFEWIGLTEGFESSLKELPQIAEREIGALEGELKGQLEALSKELGTGWTEYRKGFQGDMEAVKQAGESTAEAADKAETGLNDEAARRRRAELEAAARKVEEEEKQADQEKSKEPETKTSVLGTFSPEAVWGMAGSRFEAIGASLAQTMPNSGNPPPAESAGGSAGGGSDQSKVIAVLEQINNGIKRLNRTAGNGGLVFEGP